MLQGARARVPLHVLVTASVLLALRTVISGVPLAGAAFADVFTAHRWAASLIVRSIDRMLAGEHEAAGPAQWTSGARMAVPGAPSGGLRAPLKWAANR